MEPLNISGKLACIVTLSTTLHRLLCTTYHNSYARWYVLSSAEETVRRSVRREHSKGAPVRAQSIIDTMCPDDTATAGSWAGVGLPAGQLRFDMI
jgi:hypothetical protein